MKEQLKRAAQALEADAAQPAAADADGGGGADAPKHGVAGKAQARAKKADDYHARHAQWIAEFNELTGAECAGGEGGVKWAAVRAWQQKHWQANNLLADGLIGPKTIEAAKIVAKKNGAKDDKQDAKDGAADEKEKQHEPQPGQAEWAEAAADKRKLDEKDDAESPDQAAVEDAQLPAAGAAPKKTTGRVTLADFQTQLQKIELLLAQFKPPEARGALKSVAEDMMQGKGDASAPEPTGAMMSAMGTYLGDASKLKDDWGKLDPQGRADLLLRAINAALSKELVPDIKKAHLGSREGTAASFDASQWILNVSTEQFSRSRFDSADGKKAHVDGLSSTVFHEGRHAEQRFSVARVLARNDATLAPSLIADRAHITEEVAAKAVALEKQHQHPVSAKENASAERMAGDVVGKSEEHIALEHLIPLIGEAGTEAAEMMQQLTPEDQQKISATWKDCRARMIVALDAYYQLPTEQDAYAAEKKLHDKQR